MSDDSNQTTDEPDIPPALLERMEELDEDETIDFESKQRQDEGWLKFYVECPDCQVPMARTTVESESLDRDMVRDANRTVIRAVCPDCGAIASNLEIVRVTDDVGTIQDTFGEITDE